jgi:hypothetical protein
MANSSNGVSADANGSDRVELHPGSRDSRGGMDSSNEQAAGRAPVGSGEPRRAPRGNPKPKDKRKGRGFVRGLVKGALKRSIHPPDDPQVEENFPDFWELITMDEYKEGKSRTLPDIKITRTSGGYMVTILEHDTLQSKTFPLDRLENLAAACEKALHSDMYPWQAAKSFKNKQGLKKLKDKLQ